MRIVAPFVCMSLGCKDPLVVKEYLALVSVSPGQGATAVAVDTHIVAGFSEPLLGASVDAQSAYLEDGSGMPVVANVTYNDTAHWVIIEPETDLMPSTSYTITFTSEIQGKYSGNLISPLQTTFTTAGGNPSNELPVANAGPDQTLALGGIVELNGGESTDPEGATISFAWRLLATPVESTSTLADPTIVQPRFTPDMPGEYIVGLVVNDGLQDSSEDFVVIRVTGSAPPSEDAPEDDPESGSDMDDTSTPTTEDTASGLDTGSTALDTGTESDTDTDTDTGA